MDRKKILIIEDDALLSNMYQTKFNSEGFCMIVVADGESGIKLLSEGLNPSMVLLDIVMPKMDGIEVLEKIKQMEICKDVPVIMLTNLGQKENIDKATKSGAVGYIVKANYTPSEVVKKVREIIG
ncbi:MAG: response regulator [Patescibacteria group bacterium]